MSIENQIISIHTTDGYGNGIETKFRSDKLDNYNLIGIEIGSYERNVDVRNSINYLTGKMHTISTIIGDDDDDDDIYEEWFSVSNLKTVSFDKFTIKKILSDMNQLKMEKNIACYKLLFP